MRFFTLVAIFFAACSSLKIPLFPTQHTVEQEMQSYVKDYKELATINGITFRNTVTMGFTDIKEDSVIGLCTYGITFRQIDIDLNYWRHASDMSKMALMYHELTHCYCTRDHDFGEGKPYPAKSEDRWKTPLTPANGYFPDGCPMSMMHPVILEDTCTQLHYGEYVKEIFDRCNAF